MKFTLLITYQLQEQNDSTYYFQKVELTPKINQDRKFGFSPNSIDSTHLYLAPADVFLDR